MAKSSRKYLIAGNWKMNKTGSDAAELIKDVLSEADNQRDVGVVVCPPFTALESAAQALSDSSSVHLGAQNMYPKSSGAYTGEIAPAMLRALFVTYVILGHSERREYFKESDAFINEKVLSALENNLKPILCVGETLAEREAGDTLKVVETQLLGGLADVPADKAEQIVIAYEPVWAIGTGKTATPEMAQEVHAAIRVILRDHFDKQVADKIRILYGGSMKPENADSLLAQADIDGGLIGGAALDAISFSKLIKSAAAAAARD